MNRFQYSDTETSAMRLLTSMLQLLHISNFHLSPFFKFPFPPIHTRQFLFCAILHVYKSHLSIQLNSHAISFFGKYSNIEFHSESASKCLCNFCQCKQCQVHAECNIAVDFWVRFISHAHSIFNFTFFQ